MSKYAPKLQVLQQAASCRPPGVIKVNEGKSEWQNRQGVLPYETHSQTVKKYAIRDSNREEPTARGLLRKSLRGAKAFRPERRGNLQLTVDRKVEIAAVVSDSLAMTNRTTSSTVPKLWATRPATEGTYTSEQRSLVTSSLLSVGDYLYDFSTTIGQRRQTPQLSCRSGIVLPNHAVRKAYLKRLRIRDRR